MASIIPRFRSVLHACGRGAAAGAGRDAQDDVAKFYKGKTVQAVVGYGPGSTFELYLRDPDPPHRQAHPGQSERRRAAHAGRGLAEGDQLSRGGRAQGRLGVRHDRTR